MWQSAVDVSINTERAQQEGGTSGGRRRGTHELQHLTVQPEETDYTAKWRWTSLSSYTEWDTTQDVDGLDRRGNNGCWRKTARGVKNGSAVAFLLLTLTFLVWQNNYREDKKTDPTADATNTPQCHFTRSIQPQGSSQTSLAGIQAWCVALHLLIPPCIQSTKHSRCDLEAAASRLEHKLFGNWQGFLFRND